MAAARAAPPSAAIVIPSVTARVAPTRAIKSEPGIAATANIASGNPIRSPTWVSDMCNSSCSCGMTGGMTKSVMRMATPASQRRQSNRARPPAERPSRPEDVGMKTTRRGGVTVPQRHPQSKQWAPSVSRRRVPACMRLLARFSRIYTIRSYGRSIITIVNSEPAGL